jgi:hypothetical protein
MIDVDGVISLFGFDSARPPAGRFELVDGIAHFFSATAGEHLRLLSGTFELVWCTGWEEKANEYLPLALGLPGPLPHLRFERAVGRANAHWKLGASPGSKPLDPAAGPRPASARPCSSSLAIAAASSSPSCSSTDRRSSRRHVCGKRASSWASASAAARLSPRHDAVDQADRERLGRADGPAGEDHVHRAAERRSAAAAGRCRRRSAARPSGGRRRRARRPPRRRAGRTTARARARRRRRGRRSRRSPAWRAAAASGPSDRRRRSPRDCQSAVPIAVRSAPAQNTPPSPCSTATAASGSRRRPRNASASAAAVGPSTALRRSGATAARSSPGPSRSIPLTASLTRPDRAPDERPQRRDDLPAGGPLPPAATAARRAPRRQPPTSAAAVSSTSCWGSSPARSPRAALREQRAYSRAVGEPLGVDERDRPARRSAPRPAAGCAARAGERREHRLIRSTAERLAAMLAAAASHRRDPRGRRPTRNTSTNSSSLELKCRYSVPAATPARSAIATTEAAP